VGQFVDALKTSIMNGLAFRDLRNTNCEDDKTELDNLHSFLEESDASPPHPSTNHGTGTDDAVAIYGAEQVKHMPVVSLPDVCYVASTVMTVRHVLHPHHCWKTMFSFTSKSMRMTDSL
jgi:hypothetical protein